ncbi:MAG: glycosyl hydrolase [Phycisphaerae bacterium]|nr:glycosyl hydrolase [Phycisphaerae bacterium]
MNAPARVAVASALTVALMLGCQHPLARASRNGTASGSANLPSEAPHQATEPVNRVTTLTSSDAASPSESESPRLSATVGEDGHRLLREDDLRGLPWRSIGPANMSGRVSDFAVAPSDPKTFFIAYATGGLWKTINFGTTFQPVFDEYETASIGAVAVADAPENWSGWAAEESKSDKPLTPGEPEKPRAERGKGKIVWVGTGEGNGRNSSSWGNGVYLSTDGGAKFTWVGLKETHDIPQLAIDPRDPDTVYVAAMGRLWGPNPERGLYKTTDRGKTWKAVLQVNDLTGCCDVIIDPRNPDTVYAAMYTRMRTPWSFRGGGPDGGIFRSDDAGATWTKLTEGLPGSTGRIGLDVFRKDPRIVYASVESDEGGRTIDAWHNYSRSGGIFRSEDRGETWTRMSDLSQRPFYFSRIRIDPENDQRIYQPGWTLAVSDDGGRNFRAGLSRITHVDLHAFWIDPADPKHLLLGTDGGAYVSYDRGENWDFFNHMPVGQFYNVAFDMSDPYRVGGGLQDNGSWIGPSESLHETGDDTLGEEGCAITNADWTFVYGGDGFHVAFDPVDADIIYAELQGGDLSRIHLDTGRRKKLNPAPKEGEPRFRFNWNTPFFISLFDHTTLYVGGNYVFKLTQRGDQWERISDDLSANDIDKVVSVGSEAETYGTVVSLAESPLAQGLLWAGTDDGRIHVTADDGTLWTDVTPPQVDGRYIAEIEPSHHARDTAYIAVDGHRSADYDPLLLVTEDLGNTWRAVTGNLPAGWSTRVIREDLRNPDVLYVGTEQAMWLSIDRGRTWTKLNGKSLPTVRVDDLKQHPREMDLIAGTHGRSIYILDDATPLSQLSQEVLDAPLHLFDIPDAKPRIFMPLGGIWTQRIFCAKNPPMGAYVSYWLREAAVDEVNIVIKDEFNNTIRKLSGANRPGINRAVWDLQLDKHDQFGNPEQWLGQTRFVPPGRYTATVTVGDQSATKSFTVLPSPIEYDR